MVTLVGMWESGWFSNRVEYFMWKQLCAAFNVDRLVMVGETPYDSRVTISVFGRKFDAL